LVWNNHPQQDVEKVYKQPAMHSGKMRLRRGKKKGEEERK
jgi:hypothetical protein